MAASPSDDVPLNDAEGPGSSAAPPGAEDAAATDEQTLSDSEQTLADTDQTGSDADQTAADADQASAETDQRAADRDQEASDRDFAAGVNNTAYEESRRLRHRTTVEREQSAHARMITAAERDAHARARDVAALVRDQVAAQRDRALDAREELEAAAGDGPGPRADAGLRAVDQRRRAAAMRTRAAVSRAQAAADRAAAAADRLQAARDREGAMIDREALTRQLLVLERDALTGVRVRAAGLHDLELELGRCRRSGATMVVAYVDVVGLKVLNDSQGHHAGDELLRRVVAIITANLRPYDLVVRLGGDEFLCAVAGLEIDELRARFGTVNRALATSPGGGALRVGFARWSGEETAQALIVRADRELVDSRPPRSERPPHWPDEHPES